MPHAPASLRRSPTRRAAPWRVRPWSSNFTITPSSSPCRKNDRRPGTGVAVGRTGRHVVTAVRDGRFGIRKVSFGRSRRRRWRWDHAIGDEFSFPVDIVPPAESANLPGGDGRPARGKRPPLQPRRLHPQRLYRHVPRTTGRRFVRPRHRSEARPDRPVHNRFERQPRRDHGFPAKRAGKNMPDVPCKLLATLSEKDLRDTPSAVLADHLYNTDKDADAATVLAPRAANEMLTAYRSFLRREIQPLMPRHSATIRSCSQRGAATA